MKKIKLLSDFDGIWTNQEEEASYMRTFMENKLAEISGRNTGEIIRMIERINETMRITPHLYGWKYKSETPAFFGEDQFGDNNAIIDFIEQNNVKKKPDKDLLQIKILDAGFESLEQFSTYCFTESTRIFREEGRLRPCESASKTAAKLLEGGVDLTVASNSGTDKIQYLFGKMGYDLKSESRIHTRGNAMKFVIEKDYNALPSYLEVNSEYKIPLRRKYYHELLLEEKPGYVIGDVFSLDIALPLYLSLNDERFMGLKLILKVQNHTPEWVKQFLRKKEFWGIVFMIADIEELPDTIFYRKDTKTQRKY